MSWRAYLFDTVSGQIAQKIDLPAFTWSMTVADCALSTTKSKDVGEDEIGGLDLPWTAIPGNTPEEKARAIQPYRRGIVLCWKTTMDEPDSLGRPIVAGIIGVRSSKRGSVSIPVMGLKSFLNDRVLATEGRFGADEGHTSRGGLALDGLSWRAIACEIVRRCTELKPGGALPITLPYLGEKGTHHLPVDNATTSSTSTGEKKTTRQSLPDGSIETTVDGDTTTVTEKHVKSQTRQVTETKPYTAHTKTGTVTRTHTTTRTITLRRETTVKKTVTVRKADCTRVSVTTTTTVDTFDDSGAKTGTTTGTDGPHVTEEPSSTPVTWKDFDVANHKCGDLLDRIANTDGGPDIQFRPRLIDSTHLDFQLLAGSDADQHLLQSTRLGLWTGRYGGTLHDPQVDRDGAIQRVYMTGSGQDEATLCALAEDLSQTETSDPLPLRETVQSETDCTSWELLKADADAVLVANGRPLAQWSGNIDANDVDASGMPLHPLGSIWPGETLDVAIDGFPDWPDGTYRMRLMQMSGDHTSLVKLKFDPVADPLG